MLSFRVEYKICYWVKLAVQVLVRNVLKRGRICWEFLMGSLMKKGERIAYDGIKDRKDCSEKMKMEIFEVAG